MSHQNVETVNRAADRIKLGLAVLVIAAGIVAYSVFDSQPAYIRVGAFIGGLLIAALIAWFSDTGRRTIAFAHEAYNETRRVVWPTRKETTQMTAVVFAFVVAMGALLWIADKLLEWIIYGLLLGWK
ncbi:preprotein translocase subunit SecE [Alcaligenaceae bacterium CGII-47]|nr:preprotein translocase subunit SecE [Alcaligenaceae bacterium CGII-47]